MFDGTFSQYQVEAQKTKVYPGQGEFTGLAYATLGLTGEAGEVADLVKKTWRNENGLLLPEGRMAIIDELGDVLWYVSAVCREIDEEMAAVAAMNIKKVRGRQADGTLKRRTV